jgi:hypothetical protein
MLGRSTSALGEVDMLNRRLVVKPIAPRLIAVVAVLLLVWPFAADAQRPTKVATVGILGQGAGRTPLSDAFEQFLQDLGWVKNQNIRIETRYAAGRPDALAPLAAELVGRGETRDEPNPRSLPCRR